MAVFFVNGKEVEVTKNQKLLRYLRDELHLTSVKDGCSEGACGACTVIIDGETIRACTPMTDRLEGKHIITVEGLTDEEKELYTYAYGEAGAVQCGFCIPGMVLCTKALLDRNLNPTDDQIRYALRNNYCRCTGYVKIMDAVRLAAKCRREGVIPEASENDWKLGSSVHRIDVEEKVLGYGKYPDDWYLPDMCYGSAVRSQYPRARVLAIDASKAEALPGVVRVITAADIPGENKVGHLKHDQYSLIPIGGLTHYLGDAIALVVAETPEILEKAKKLVKVTYEPLPAVHNPPEAWAEDAPRVFDEEESNVQAYKHIARGDADTAIKNSKYVISQHFETPWTEHAFLEPECAVSYIDPDGYVMVLSTDQSSHTTLHECKLLLGSDKVRVQNQLVGGGFGGKEDMSVQHHAALITYVTHLPVKVKLSRAESLLVHPKRHPFWMDFTIGCDENGLHFIFNPAGNKTVDDLGLSASGTAIIKGAQGATGTATIATFTAGFILVMITLIVVLNLTRSRAGRAIMAIRDNRIAAQAIGLNLTKYKLMAFVTSAALAGAAGALYGLNYSSLQATKFNFNLSILVLVFVVLGGLGNIWGSLVAAAALTILPEALRQFADFRMLIYAIVLIFVMLATNNPQAKAFFGRLLPHRRAAAEKED